MGSFLFLLRNDTEVVRLVLSNGANVNESFSMKSTENESINWSPLMLAIERQNLEVVQLLLEKGCDYNQAVRGQTPLEYAVVVTQNAELVKLIMSWIDSKEQKERVVVNLSNRRFFRFFLLSSVFFVLLSF